MMLEIELILSFLTTVYFINQLEVPEMFKAKLVIDPRLSTGVAVSSRFDGINEVSRKA